MRHIMVAVDFSTASNNAAGYAAMLAKQLGAELYLLHVFDEPARAIDFTFPFEANEIELLEGCKVAMQKDMDRLSKEFGAIVRGEVVSGFKVRTIVDMAKKAGAELICMGKKTQKDGILSESTVFKALRNVPVPILIIPEKWEYYPIKHIALAVDFTKMLHYSGISPLLKIVKLLDASLCLIHIQKPNVESGVEELPAKLQLGIVMASVVYVYDEIKSEDTNQTILQYVEDHPLEMLAITPHRHSLLDRALRDVHTKNLVKAAEIPMLILRSE